VEFALALPLVLVLILGMLDVGKALSYWQDETHLANEAARYAAVNGSPTKDGSGNPVPNSLAAAIKAGASTRELQSGGGSISGSGATITFSFPNGTAKHCAGDPVKVTVTSTYNWLHYLVSKIGPSAGLTATATMRLEKSYLNTGNDTYTASPAATGTCTS
jgi:Flp pilus assembly protein TadG